MHFHILPKNVQIPVVAEKCADSVKAGIHSCKKVYIILVKYTTFIIFGEQQAGKVALRL